MTVRRREGGRESGSRESERRRNSKLGVSSSGDIGNPDGITSSRIFRLAASKATPDARPPVGLGGTDYLNPSLSIRAQQEPIKLLILQPRELGGPWGWEERILWIYPCRSESKNNLLNLTLMFAGLLSLGFILVKLWFVQVLFGFHSWQTRAYFSEVSRVISEAPFVNRRC